MKQKLTDLKGELKADRLKGRNKFTIILDFNNLLSTTDRIARLKNQ